MDKAKSLGQITYVSAEDSLPLVNGDYIIVSDLELRHSDETFETVWFASWDEDRGWSVPAYDLDGSFPLRVVRWALIQAYGSGL